MPGPWRGMIEAETIEVVAPGGAVRGTAEAWFSGEQFIIEDMSLDVRPGDEIRRRLPNGLDDVYAVTDPTCYRTSPFGPHYQVKISRRGPMEHHTGGNFITVNGPNARVNINSTDNSTNIANSGSVFGDLRSALEAGIADETHRGVLLAEVDRMEAAQKDPGKFAQAFQSFVSLAADGMTIITPFLPQLTALLAS